MSVSQHPFLFLRPTAVAVACCVSGITQAHALKMSYALAAVPLSVQAKLAAPPTTAPLTLASALNLALVKDLRYASALAAFRAAQELVPQARAGFRPQFSLSGTMGASNGRPSSSTRTEELTETHTDSVLATQSDTQTQTQVTTQQDGLPGAGTDTRSTSSTATQSNLTEQTLENLNTSSWQTSSQNTRGWVANAELSMRWTIYRPGMERQLELSQIRVAQAEVQLQAARQDVVLRLTRAYFDLILSHEELRAIGSEKLAIEAQLKVAEQSFKEGETTIADVKEAQAKWDIVQAQEVAQRNRLQIRQTSLQALTGERSALVQSLKADELLQMPPAMGALTDWIARAESRSYQVLFDTLGLAAAEKEVARQGAAFKPSLDFVASLGTGRRLQRSRSEIASAISEDAHRNEPSQSTVASQTDTSSSRDGESVSGSSSGSSNSSVQSSSSESIQSSSYRPASSSRTLSTQIDAYVGLRLNIPLSDGGFSNSKVREALALQDQRALDLQRVKADAALAAETAFLEAQGFFAEASALRAAERSGEVALKSNQMGYQAGVRINSDILNAQQQLFAVRRDLLKTHVSALLATLRLKASAGALVEEDVTGLSRWLQ
ncbi:TolC family protein [Hydrogenophaga crassostreae]|nr:TolC family protein [Hydrogenophaga crassostreae]